MAATERTPLVSVNGGTHPPPTRRRTLKAALGISGLVIVLCVMVAIVVGFSPTQSSSHSALTPGVSPGVVPFTSSPHPQKPSSLWGAISRPYPTGAWWTNFVVGNGDQQVVTHPYSFKAASNGLQVSYSAWRRITSSRTLVDIFAPDWVMGADQESQDHYVVRYDPLTVHVYFVGTSTGGFKALLAKGSPYATIEYSRAAPLLRPMVPIASVNGVGLNTLEGSNNLMNGQRFDVVLSNGQRWLVYSSFPIAFEVTKTGLSAPSGFKGMLRLAFVPSGCPDLVDLLDAYAGGVPVAASVEADLDDPALLVTKNVFEMAPEWDVHGATVTFDYSVMEWPEWKGGASGATDASSAGQSAVVEDKSQSSPTILQNLRHRLGFESGLGKTYRNTYTTKTRNLLMLSLPHHIWKDGPEIYTSSATDYLMPSDDICVQDGVPAGYQSIKGSLRPKVGSHWVMVQAMYSVDFVAPRPLRVSEVTGQLNATSVETLVEQLRQDALAVPPIATDSYNFGKEVSRLANLLVIAAEFKKVSVTNADALDKIESGIVQRLMKAIAPWLQSSPEVPNTLLFDETYGGVVTRNGLQDKQADYGNGWYNDHHFHYGYFIYAAAVLVKFHPDWASTYGLAVDSLVRDIAAQLPESGNGPEDLSRSQPAADPLFPTARQKDWFDGHSWASGLFPQGNGKSQESSSEAVNAYYAVSLYGLATGNAELQKWGSFLLSSEIHAAQYYYHIGRDNTIYEPPFSASRMVGNLGAGDVTASTWFGDKPEYVHGIQALPVRPFTEFLFPPSYVRQEIPILINALEGWQPIEPFWQGILGQLEAIVDMTRGTDKINSISDFGPGSSKTQATYWLLTRPLESLSSEAIASEQTANADADKIPQECAKIASCRVLGLVGMCCPSSTGVHLGCCPMS